MPVLKLVKAEKQTHTQTDTIVITKDVLAEWDLPPFQRPLKANAKVLALAEELKSNGGVMPGVLTIGVLKSKKYLVDGQHRKHAFEISGIEEGYSDVRFRVYDSMAEMAEDFVQLNSVLVRMRPDDILRGLEGSNDALTVLRQKCPFVGYDQIRRGTAAPIVSMSALLRCWVGSGNDTPRAASGSATELARTLSIEEADTCAGFLRVAMTAWGKDQEYFRLWGNLNLTVCMWIYRRMVLTSHSVKVSRISREMFGKCMAALSASPDYLDWLLGRQMGDRDRAPAYRRIKACFVRRIETETGKKQMFPQPEWAHGN